MAHETLTDQAMPHDPPASFAHAINADQTSELSELDNSSSVYGPPTPDEMLADASLGIEETVYSDEPSPVGGEKHQDPWFTTGIKNARIQRRRPRLM